LQNASLDNFPWLKGRLDHLRLSELRDTSTPRKEQAAEGLRFAPEGVAQLALCNRELLAGR